jgi:hypothetical protein
LGEGDVCRMKDSHGQVLALDCQVKVLRCFLLARKGYLLASNCPEYRPPSQRVKCPSPCIRLSLLSFSQRHPEGEGRPLSNGCGAHKTRTARLRP